MTDDPTRQARPMTAADYVDGFPIQALHPTRDLVLGAVIGAVALWAVPKALDYLVGTLGGREEWPDDEADEIELQVSK